MRSTVRPAPSAPEQRPAGGWRRSAAVLAGWRGRQWTTAGLAAVATALVIGLPTDVIPNPVFGRPVPVTWWAVPTLVVTAVLGGVLVGTYVRPDPTPPASAPSASAVEPSAAASEPLDRPGRLGGVAGLVSFFAVGCPVCNKLVLVALGSSGAMNVFAPLQPVLAVASIAGLAAALRLRLRTAVGCPLPTR